MRPGRRVATAGHIWVCAVPAAPGHLSGLGALMCVSRDGSQHQKAVLGWFWKPQGHSRSCKGCVPYISLYRQSGLVGARRVQWDNRENTPASRPFITSAKTLFLNQVICSFLRLGSNIFGALRQPVTVCM